MNDQPHSFKHEAMDTTFELIVAEQEREYARQASAAAFREIDRIEKLLNKYDAGSDVGQVNLLKAGEMVRVGLETLECLEKAIWAHTVSGGLFDPTVGTGFQWLEIDRTDFSIGWKKNAAADVQTGKSAPRNQRRYQHGASTGQRMGTRRWRSVGRAGGRHIRHAQGSSIKWLRNGGEGRAYH
jgi:hypothetical protein